ncbi:lipase secretion chaperone [Acinetobacter soli]|uniref:lipase secretion chaperone n=1 Tax=Acinetobacter soli TaxID=487316 RepID=UPI00125075AF|nr:lipase secretion chaperone [Acinetobacter soli]MDQ9834344.1 lipase secretion chaperone [Acinetobacter soli]
MQGSKKIYIWTGVLGLVVLVTLLVMWLRPAASSAQRSDVTATQLSAASAVHPSAQNAANTTMPFSSTSQRDTEINCQLKRDGSNRLVVNEQTRNCFEYFLTQYGEKSIAQIDQDFKAYLAASLTEPALSQTTDLWQRYLKYREALGTLPEPAGPKNELAYFQSVFASRMALRQRFFSAPEIEGLFGSEDLYNQYTLNRMRILNNNALSDVEKAKQLRALFDQLPTDWKANLEQLSTLDDLRQLTASIKRKGGSAQELHDMRTQLVGPEATTRLENLDTQRTAWKATVTQYLDARQSILDSSMSDSAKQKAIESLRNSTFSRQQDQVRIQTFETAKDRGQRLPLTE